MKKIKFKSILQIIYTNKTALIIGYLVMLFIAIQDRNLYQNRDISISSYMLIFFADHYNIMSFLLPIIVYVMARTIKNRRDIEMIRYKNSYEFIHKNIVEFTIVIFCFFLLLVVTRFLVGLGRFPLSTEISTISYKEYFNETLEVFNQYASYFDNGLLAFVLAYLYTLLGLITFYALLNLVNYSFSYKIMVGLAIIIFVSAYIGFKTSLSLKLPMLFLNNYLLLHHGLFRNDPGNFTIIIIIATVIISYSFIKYKNLERRK